MTDFDGTPEPPSHELTVPALNEPEYYPHRLFNNDCVVLALGRRPLLFHIPRFILVEHSPVLRASLGSKGSDGNDFEGASLDDGPIALPDDDPDRFADVLSVYYGPTLAPDLPRTESAMTAFERKTGNLRLASKYGFALAVKHAADDLRGSWSTESGSWRKILINPSRNDVRRAISLINLCRELDIHEFLGCAFYLLCADTKWSESPDLTYEHLRKADILLMRKGIQCLYRQYAEPGRAQALTRGSRNDKISSGRPWPSSAFPSDSKPHEKLPAQGSLGLIPPLKWEEFICSAAAMRCVIQEMGLPYKEVISSPWGNLWAKRRR
ncbi:hypothetical protein BOTBODRAFT_596488, partial [Botryobasidium botryosum FD-172 SS1]